MADRSERDLQAHGKLLDGANVGFVVTRADGTVIMANLTAMTLLGRELTVGQVMGELPDGARTSECGLHDVDGSDLVATVLVPPARADRGPGISGETLRTIIDATPVGVCITTEDGTFEQVNPAYCRLYGYEPDALIGQSFTMIVPPEDRDGLADLHRRFIDGGVEIRGEWTVLPRDGVRREILADACRIVGTDGRYRKVTFVVDITERKRLEAELHRANEILADLARHDPLTNLANHRHTFELLAAAAETSERHGRELTVAALDLDHFKRVNDRYGHRIGDEVLVGFAEAMRSAVRAPDGVGRVGGEEFLLVLPDTTVADAVGLLDRLRSVCTATPMSSAGITVTFSAGLASFASGDRAQSLVDRADDALYQAKEQGRGRTVLG